MLLTKYFKYILAFSAAILFITACSDDPIIDKAEDELISNQGAIATISNVVGGFFNLVDKENTAVSFDLGTAGEDVSEIIVSKALNGGDVIEHARVAPGTVNVSLSDAISGMTGVTLESIDVGDVFTFSFQTVTSSGTYISGKTLDVAASCPSALSGEYTFESTSTSTDGCCPGVTNQTGEMTLDGADGVYTLIDFSQGVYFTWYAIYGVTEAMQTDGSLSISFQDVCGQLSGVGPEPFGTEVSITGSVDAATGVITYNWVNGFDDQGEIVLTPK